MLYEVPLVGTHKLDVEYFDNVKDPNTAIKNVIGLSQLKK